MAAMVAALILVGAILLFLETILPGLVAGLIGLICVASGVVLSYLHFEARTAHLILLGVVLGGIAGAAAWFRFFPGSRVAKLFISERAVGEVGAERPELLHQTGIAHTNLRPSGTAIISGKRVDVVTEGALIERGAAVQVVGVEGMRVIVRSLAGAPEANDSPAAHSARQSVDQT